MIHGKNKMEHDECFQYFMEITIKWIYLSYSSSYQRYMDAIGLIIIWTQIQPSCMPAPTNAEDLLFLLGMVNYLSRFSPHLTDLMEPHCQLTHNVSDLEWKIPHHDAFIWSKVEISSVCTLPYFVPKEVTIIQAEISKKGQGAELACYAPCAINP